MNETLRLDDLIFEIRRSQRRKTLGLTVDRAGELVVHAPESTNQDELRRWVSRKLLWVHRKLALKNELKGFSHRLDFVSGESIFYLGRNYRLKLVDEQDTPLRFDGHWFFLRRKDRHDAAWHFRQWYLKTGSQWLHRRAETWEPRTGVTPSGVAVRDLGFHWGSCGRNGNLYFNWRLLQLPMDLSWHGYVDQAVQVARRFAFVDPGNMLGDLGYILASYDRCEEALAQVEENLVQLSEDPGVIRDVLPLHRHGNVAHDLVMRAIQDLRQEPGAVFQHHVRQHARPVIHEYRIGYQTDFVEKDIACQTSLENNGVGCLPRLPLSPIR